MLHQARNEVYINLYNGFFLKCPNLKCAFHLVGEITRAEYATVN